MKNKIIKSGLVAFLWIAYIIPSMAGPVDPPADEDPMPEPGAPIDNWMFILVIAAAAIGVYFLWKKQKSNCLNKIQ